MTLLHRLSHQGLALHGNLFYGVDKALLEEVVVGVGVKVSKAQAKPSGSLFFLPSSDFNEELLVTSPVKCLPVSCHDFYPDNTRLNLSNCKFSEFFSFIKVYLVIMALYIYRTLTFESSPPGNCHKILTTKLPLN